MWTSIKGKTPELPGYYYTYYFNTQLEKWLYKAIWWNGKHWINWHPKFGKYIETVEKYIKESRNDYYCPCLEWIEKLMAERNINCLRDL